MPGVPDKFLQASQDDDARLITALKGGQLSGTADLVAHYEIELEARFGAAHAIAVSSGSAALHAVLHACGDGSEVLVPATAPLPSVFPITSAGATPVPVDIRRNSLDFDPDDLRAKITKQTRAALVVPLWGYPIDLTETIAILSEAQIPLVEDAAHAHGARCGDKMVGTFGAAGCFSTHDRKLLATGEGGFVLTDDVDLAEAIRSVSRLGNLTGQRWGMNLKLNALAAALGLARLPNLTTQIATRRAVALALKIHLAADLGYAELDHPHDSEPNYYNLVLLLSDVSAEVAQSRLNRINQLGIPIDQIKYGYDVFYRRPVYRHLAISCPNAEDFVSRAIQLPVHPGIGQSERDRMLEILWVIGNEG